MNRFRSLSKFKQISIIVLSIHFVFLAFLAIESAIRPFRNHQKMTVQTFQFKPPPSPKIASPPKNKPSTVSKAIAKKTAPASTRAPKPMSPKSPPSSRQKSSSENLLKQIEENLSDISVPSILPKTSIDVPTLAETPLPLPNEQSSFTDRLALFLQEMLLLPEFGEVKAQITIDPTGHLQNFQILESKSQKNETFLKNRLPELQYPCFNETVSLTITFSNAL